MREASTTSTTHTGIYGCEYTYTRTLYVYRSSIICGKVKRQAVYNVDITDKRTDERRKKNGFMRQYKISIFHLFLNRFFKKQLILFCCTCFTRYFLYRHRCYWYSFDITIHIFFFLLWFDWFLSSLCSSLLTTLFFCSRFHFDRLLSTKKNGVVLVDIDCNCVC